MNFSSTRVPNAPYVQASLRVKYNFDLPGNIGVMVPSFQVQYNSGVFLGSVAPLLREEEALGPAVGPALSQGAYALVNVRLDWEKPMGRDGVVASFFVTNLFNQLYATGDDDVLTSNGFALVNYGPPREWGIRLSAKW
jgi:outer membrane receptor protein involved in Fe transport